MARHLLVLCALLMAAALPGTLALPSRFAAPMAKRRMQPRIIRGQTEDAESLFPYAVKVLRNGQPLCTGSVVSSTHILTAAQCLKLVEPGVPASELSVEAGGKRIRVSAAYVHEDFDAGRIAEDWAFIEGRAPFADLAVLVLAEPTTAPAVSLPPVGAEWKQAPAPGAKVWIAGFGMNETGRFTDALEYTSLTVYAENQCDPAPSDNFCAGNPTSGSCQGDNGGPVVQQLQSGLHVLVGITSWGRTCADLYGYSTRVADHLGWIDTMLSRTA